MLGFIYIRSTNGDRELREKKMILYVRENNSYQEKPPLQRHLLTSLNSLWHFYEISTLLPKLRPHVLLLLPPPHHQPPPGWPAHDSVDVDVFEGRLMRIGHHIHRKS